MKHLRLLSRNFLVSFSLLLAAMTGGLTGCATSNGVAHEYREILDDDRTSPSSRSSNRQEPKTAIVILVDGLGAEALRKALQNESLPELRRFFSAPHGNVKSGRFGLARASFPTLTYPNLVSLVTGEPVSHHRVTGNRTLNGEGKIANFENILHWRQLEKTIGVPTAFAQLEAQGFTSANFSYPLTNSSSANQKPSVEAAAGYASKEYDAVDTYTLESAATLLETTDPAKWPRLVFIHLIAVDGAAHEFGPTSTEHTQSLKMMDKRLTRLFAAIESGESSGRQVNTVLTADHGFVEISYRVSLEKLLRKMPSASEMKVVTDNRVVGLFPPPTWTRARRQTMAAELSAVPKVSWTAVHQVVPDRKRRSIELFFADGRKGRIDYLPALECNGDRWAARFMWLAEQSVGGAKRQRYHCLSAFDAASDEMNEAYRVSALVEYFSAPNAPELIVVPEDDADFSGEYRGNHGGLTRTESLVPLLTRHVRFDNEVVPLHRVLHLLELFSK